MKKTIFAFLAFATLSLHAADNLDIDAALQELDTCINDSEQYYRAKESKIAAIKKELLKLPPPSDNRSRQFNLYNRLFDEYSFYQYDSAYVYARKMESLASGSEQKAVAMSALLFCYKSTGFFNEATEIIRSFNPGNVSSKTLLHFYTLCAETYQNLSSFVWRTHDLSEQYDRTKQFYYHKALDVAEKGTYEYCRTKLEIDLIENWSDSLALTGRHNLIDNFHLDEHELAVQYSILSSSYGSLGKTEESIYYRALSAICDIRSATRETTSAKVLAEEMYKRNDITYAYKYICQALSDAIFYNSQLRIIEINTIFPQIESRRYSLLNNQKDILLVSGSIVLVLLFLTLILFLKVRKKNRQLSALNRKLEETSDIKDRYIIQSLYGNTNFVNELDRHVLSAIRFISSRQYDEAKAILYNLGIKKEREKIYESFDTAFLQLFPNFISEYKALFPQDAVMELEGNGILPMEVRIFALMRLGIDNTTQVAEYLNLSVNTVYVYKTKVKSKAICPKEEFDDRIRAIPKP